MRYILHIFRVKSFLAFCLLILVGVTPETVRAQPITFPSSMSIGEDDYMVRVQPWYERSTDDPSGQGRELTDWNTRLFGMYGLSEKTALFSRVSYIDREYNNGSSVHTENGFSDLEVFVRHTAYEQNWVKRTFSVSPYAGVKLPTGDDTSPGLPRDRTLGSGATDYLVGFAVRDATLGKPHRFLNMEYQFNQEDNGFERGDVFKINGAWKPPLASWEHKGDVAGVNGMLEANFKWQDHHERNGNEVTDSGGTQLFGTAGMVYTTHRYIYEVAVQAPLVQNMNGNALENDYKVLVGIWRNF